MPAAVTVKNLGDPKKEANLRVLLQKLLEHYAGTWKVIVVGSQKEEIWELIVTGPHKRGQWVFKKFCRQAGECNIEAILKVVRRIAEQALRETAELPATR